jgi:hypothetical protein
MCPPRAQLGLGAESQRWHASESSCPDLFTLSSHPHGWIVMRAGEDEAEAEREGPCAWT